MDEQRAEFEAWASRNRHDIARMLANPAIYDCNYTQVLWEGWEPATQRQRERIAELEAQVTALTLETERTARNRDMWKGQTQRQADRLQALHSCMAALKRLLARDPCAHANTAIQMIDAANAPQPNSQAEGEPT